MTISEQTDGSRARARPGRGLRLPSFSPHKVCPAPGSRTVLSERVHAPLSTQAIARPLACAVEWMLDNKMIGIYRNPNLIYRQDTMDDKC